MAIHSSASTREHTLHTINSVTDDTLRRHAESVIQDKSIDADSRAIIRYALEINDPMLSELVQWASAGCLPWRGEVAHMVSRLHAEALCHVISL